MANRPGNPRPFTYPPQKRKQVFDAYTAGLSVREVCRITGVGKHTVTKIVRERGGRVRSVAEAKARPGSTYKDNWGYIRETVMPSDVIGWEMAHSRGVLSRIVLQHRLVMAHRLGRPLYTFETVHHINGDLPVVSTLDVQRRRRCTEDGVRRSLLRAAVVELVLDLS